MLSREFCMPESDAEFVLLETRQGSGRDPSLESENVKFEWARSLNKRHRKDVLSHP